MEQVQNRCNHNALQYIQQTENNSARMTGLHNSTYNPLGKPEVTINLNEVFISWAFQPMLDELGENVIGDSDNDSLTQDSSTDSEEQVVPSSQTSNGAKIPEDTITLDNEITSGNLTPDMTLYNVTSDANSNVYDSQPP